MVQGSSSFYGLVIRFAMISMLKLREGKINVVFSYVSKIDLFLWINHLARGYVK